MNRPYKLMAILPRGLLVLSALISIFLLPSISLVQSWDQQILVWIQGHRSPAWSVFFLFITYLGSTLGFLISLLGGFLYHALKRRWKTAFIFLVGIGLWKLSASLLKILVGRERPPGALLEINTLSMPSGHAVNAVFIYGVWGVILWQKTTHPILRGLIFLSALLMILLTDYSRLYFGVHYFSDVLMGSLWAVAGLYVLQGLREEFLSISIK